MIETWERTPVKVGGRVLKREDFEGDIFIHSIGHILDDNENPLCGTNAQLCLNGPPPESFLGELEGHDKMMRSTCQDEYSYTCRSCIRSAKARIKNGWTPTTQLTVEDCHY